MKKLSLCMSLLALLAVSVGGFELGWQLSPKPEALQVSANIQEDPLVQFRREREQLRAMQRSQLNDIIHGGAADAEIIGMAQRQLVEICESEEAEITLEGILRMRGYEDCVATVHPDSVNILIRTELITRQDSSLIMELACRETGVQSGNIKIIPINSAK